MRETHVSPTTLRKIGQEVHRGSYSQKEAEPEPTVRVRPPRQFLGEFGVDELYDRGVLNGETLELNSSSVQPLLSLMAERRLTHLRADTNWELVVSGQFENSRSRTLKSGDVSALSSAGDVFWLRNREINPHYLGTTSNKYVDQHDLWPEPGPVSSQDASRNVYSRSTRVRKVVLSRAEGKCEFCGAEGFETYDGRRFLETHHVIPVSEGGRDWQWNVIALCPSDHRRAHFARERRELHEQMTRLLDGKRNA
ncbi:MAG: hypothetical protein GKR94_22405 [Gammaproteobacteria bacterium]|nr:hypothetical protein [Gammaproteobacteria bacterium]